MAMIVYNTFFYKMCVQWGLFINTVLIPII